MNVTLSLQVTVKPAALMQKQTMRTQGVDTAAATTGPIRQALSTPQPLLRNVCEKFRALRK